MKTKPGADLKTKCELKAAVMKAATTNHIWINAFTLIRPTDKTLLEIGRLVVQMLQERENLLPSYTPGDDGDEIHELSRLTPCLYLYVNAS